MLSKTENVRGYLKLDIKDANDKIFSIWQGGNFDLYWSTDEEDLSFDIDQSDTEVYVIFNNLFNEIKKNDNVNKPLVHDNTFFWIGEDDEPEKANRMKIKKDQNKFNITFEKNLKHMQPRFFTSICFCNSGSNYPRIVECFMKMYLHTAYNIDFEEKC